MNWRPEGWSEQKIFDTTIRKLCDYDRVILEAGADAMLEALRTQQGLRRLPLTFNGTFIGYGDGKDLGTLCFIPDEKKTDKGALNETL